MPPILPERWRIAVARFLSASLPHSCLLCGADSPGILCPACADDLPRLAPGCPQCAEPTTHGERCGRCLTHAPNFDATSAVFRYSFPLDSLVHSYKYAGELSLAAWFAHEIAGTLRGKAFHRLIPMPLHPARLRERGFNQAVEIARYLSQQLGIPLDITTCQRSRASPPQAALPHRDRAANVRGVFECRAPLTGLNLLLVDDVMTTGATVDECARLLKIHGAASVSVAVVARALRS